MWFNRLLFFIMLLLFLFIPLHLKMLILIYLLQPLSNLSTLYHLNLPPLSSFICSSPSASLQCLAISHWAFPHSPHFALGIKQLNYKHRYNTSTNTNKHTPTWILPEKAFGTAKVLPYEWWVSLKVIHKHFIQGLRPEHPIDNCRV